jgi:hypothetical protein
MRLPERLDRVLQCALDGDAPTRDDCVYLLDLPAASLEAAATRAVADVISRRRFENRAMLLGSPARGLRWRRSLHGHTPLPMLVISMPFS